MTVSELQSQLTAVLQPWLGNYRRTDGDLTLAICVGEPSASRTFDPDSPKRLECVIDPLWSGSNTPFLGGDSELERRWRITLKAWPQKDNVGYALCLNDARMAIWKAWPLAIGPSPQPATKDTIPQVIVFIPDEDSED
jgi:hypothetical protein